MLPRSTPLRLALGFATLFLLGALISNLVALNVIDAELGDRRDLRLRDRYDAYLQVYRSDGLPALVAAIDASDRRNATTSTMALLLDRDGGVLAGASVAAWFGTALSDGWSVRSLSGSGLDSEDNLRVFTGPLGTGRLVVADSGHDAAEVREIVLGAFAWGALVLVVLAIGGAAHVATRFRLRFAALRDTMRRVADGDLAARVPLSRRGDDIDAHARDVNNALSRLERSVGQVRQVSSDIAHDLRTPLSRLRIDIEQALGDARAGRATDAVLAQALMQCDELSSTFSALLRIARLESGARRAHFAPVDLWVVLERTVDLYADVAEDVSRSVALLPTDVGQATIEGDESLLTQLFANLIENALQHAPTGSTIRCGLRSAADLFVVTIADDGPGIPLHERDNVLRRLYRLDSSRSTPGSGLGLSLVKAVVDLHGASLDLLDNEPGLRVRIAFARRAVLARRMAGGFL